MQYIHVKNLERFHPGYKDRSLLWAKINCAMAQGDPEMEMIDNEIDKWRFICLILLELQAKKPLPFDDGYFTRKGFDLKKRSMSLTVQMLHNFINIVDESVEPSTEPVPQSREEKIRERVDKRESRLYVDFEKSTTELWNSFCINYPSLSKITEVSEKRRAKLKKRFERESFRNFQVVLDAIAVQKFLMGENKSNWKVSFDWLIENDTNYLKVLEFKYGKNASEDAGFSAKWRNDALK